MMKVKTQQTYKLIVYYDNKNSKHVETKNSDFYSLACLYAVLLDQNLKVVKATSFDSLYMMPVNDVENFDDSDYTAYVFDFTKK